MLILPLIVNGVVIAVISAELIAISSGLASADELLAVSSVSGLLTLASYKLSKDALSHATGTRNLSKEQAVPDD